MPVYVAYYKYNDFGAMNDAALAAIPDHTPALQRCVRKVPDRDPAHLAEDIQGGILSALRHRNVFRYFNAYALHTDDRGRATPISPEAYSPEHIVAERVLSLSAFAEHERARSFESLKMEFMVSARALAEHADHTRNTLQAAARSGATHIAVLNDDEHYQPVGPGEIVVSHSMEILKPARL